jgi:hypothetical protein
MAGIDRRRFMKGAAVAAAVGGAGLAFDFDQAPRLQIGLQQLQTPTVYESVAPQCELPDEISDFELFAESQLLRDLGIEVRQPSLAEMLGQAAPGITAPVAGTLEGAVGGLSG